MRLGMEEPPVEKGGRKREVGEGERTTRSQSRMLFMCTLRNKYLGKGCFFSSLGCECFPERGLFAHNCDDNLMKILNKNPARVAVASDAARRFEKRHATLLSEPGGESDGCGRKKKGRVGK